MFVCWCVDDTHPCTYAHTHTDADVKANWPKLQTMRVMKTSSKFIVDEHFQYIKTLGIGAYGIVMCVRFFCVLLCLFGLGFVLLCFRLVCAIVLLLLLLLLSVLLKFCVFVFPDQFVFILLLFLVCVD